jgi:hypothetical protein
MINLKLITMFNVAPTASEDKLSFLEVNAESAKYGWIVHPDCCSKTTLAWVKAEAKTNYNKTFYKKWEDITSKTRIELLADQLVHYATTYGTGFTAGNGYVPNQSPDVEIPYQSFKVIMPATDEEIYNRCIKMLQSGIALESETLNILIDYIVKEDRYVKYGLDIDTIKNKEAVIMLMDITNVYGKDPFNMLRYFVFKATGKAMLIKDRRTIQTIKENASKVDFTRLSETECNILASVFYRFKPLFLAFKHTAGVESAKVFQNEAFRKVASKLKAVVAGKATNASVINHIRRLAVSAHKPFKPGFWETIITEEKPLTEVADRLAKDSITNFKKITLMQAILAKLQNASGKMYVIRNGKMWVREDAPKVSQNMNAYLMRVYGMLEDSIVNSIKDKACTVRYPKNVNLTVPTSEKNFIGNYPFGTSVDMGEDHNVIGIYWRNEWGTRDFDLHLADINGNSYGWNAAYTDKKNKIIFSGDMTNAEPEATELFYISKTCPDGKVSVSQFSGSPKSQFKFFVARENRSNMENRGYSSYNGRECPMCDPNNIKAEFIIPVDGERDKQCALIVDNKVYLMDLTQGGGRVPNQKYAQVYIENLKNKCRSFVDLKPILEKAGFTFVEDGDEKTEVALDLTQLSKDTLIDLFSTATK